MEAINDLAAALKNLDTPEGLEFARKVKSLKGLRVIYPKENTFVFYVLECPYCERKIYRIRSRFRHIHVEHFSDKEYKLHKCDEYDNATPEFHADISRALKIRTIWLRNKPKKLTKMRENTKYYLNHSIWDEMKAALDAKQ